MMFPPARTSPRPRQISLPIILPEGSSSPLVRSLSARSSQEDGQIMVNATEAQLRAEVISLRRNNGSLQRRVTQLQGLLGELQPLWFSAPQEVQDKVQSALSSFTPRVETLSGFADLQQDLEEWQELMTRRSGSSGCCDTFRTAGGEALTARTPRFLIDSAVSTAAPTSPEEACEKATETACESQQVLLGGGGESDATAPAASKLDSAPSRPPRLSTGSAKELVPPLPPLRSLPGGPPLNLRNVPASGKSPGNVKAPIGGGSGGRAAAAPASGWMGAATVGSAPTKDDEVVTTPPETARHRLDDSSDDGSVDGECCSEHIGSVTVSSEQYENLLETLATEAAARKRLEKQVENSRSPSRGSPSRKHRFSSDDEDDNIAFSPSRKHRFSTDVKEICEDSPLRTADCQGSPARKEEPSKVIERILRQQEDSDRRLNNCLDAISREWAWHGMPCGTAAADSWGVVSSGAWWPGRHAQLGGGKFACVM